MRRKYFDEHGCSSRLYKCWAHMKERCYREADSDYKNYGGRGIRVCDEWRNDYLAFKEWALANGYEPSLTIDRIDYNGNYEPSNCRWATWKEQSNNRRGLHYLTYNGETKTLTEWSEITGISFTTLYMRLTTYGWSVEKALSTRVRRREKIENCRTNPLRSK